MDELLAPTSTAPVFALNGQVEPPTVGGRENRKKRDEINGLLALLLDLIVLRASVPRTRSAAWSQKSAAHDMITRHYPLGGAAPGCGRHHVWAVRPSPFPAGSPPARRRSKMSALSYNLPLRAKFYFKASPGAQTFDPIPGPQVSLSILLFSPEGRSCGEHSPKKTHSYGKENELRKAHLHTTQSRRV